MEEARPLWNLLNNQIPKASKILYAAIRGPRSEIPHTLTVPYSSLSTFLFLINSSYILHRLILKHFGCSTIRLRIQFLPVKRSGVGVGGGGGGGAPEIWQEIAGSKSHPVLPLTRPNQMLPVLCTPRSSGR